VSIELLAAELTREEAQSLVFVFLATTLGAALSRWHLRLVLPTVVVATAFHEIGHASACRFSGARPGEMGVGVYLIWPAFYCDVTDAYRLDRPFSSPQRAGTRVPPVES
jgi:hypothetical protein